MKKLCVLLACWLLAGATEARAWAQSGVAVSGTVTNVTGAAPVAAALVVLESPKGNRETKTDANGKYVFSGVPAGTYHLVVRVDGYQVPRQDVTVATAAVTVDVQLTADLHFSEVTSVSPDARSQFDAYQATNVLGGQELAKALQATLAGTLANEPGVATRGFGPGPARPVIRGLDGDRVLVLEDGQRMGDLSSQSGDHGVNVNPAAAQKIEVVRGPATLLYGANAIGGLVNVVTKNVPTERVAKPSGTLTFDTGSAARETVGAGDLSVGSGNFALHLSANGHRSGDYRTPNGTVSNSFNRGGAFQIGAGFVGENGYVGASVGYDKNRYGIPLVEEGDTNLNPRRTLFDFRAEQRNLGGFINSYRVTFGARRYQHDEMDGDVIATSFKNDTNEFEVLANHQQVGAFKGTVGGWGMTRSFSATGDEVLSPPVDQKAAAAFLYEEAALGPHASFQFGGRIDRTSYTPKGLTGRDFTNFSGSLGFLVHPSDQTTVAVSLARAARNPALEELYFNGPHGGNNAFEVGDDTLKSEYATGADVSFRWQSAVASGEVAYFYNHVNNYIYRRLTGEVDEDLPVAVFTQGDAVLQGIESHLDLHLTSALTAEAGLDYVRGQLSTLSVPLPRIPPLRGRLGLRYQYNAFQIGADVSLVNSQNRVFTTPLAGGALNETPTDGYGLFKAYAAYSFVSGTTLHTLALRVDNVGNTLYRSHLNYLKDLAPEVGRDVRLSYTIKF